jgi:hypothetical protein
MEKPIAESGGVILNNSFMNSVLGNRTMDRSHKENTRSVFRRI